MREVSRRICLIWVVAKSLYHASTGDLWLAFYEGWRRFVWACRAASAVLREGDFGAVFPDFSFRPWTPPL